MGTCAITCHTSVNGLHASIWMRTCDTCAHLDAPYHQQLLLHIRPTAVSCDTSRAHTKHTKHDTPQGVRGCLRTKSMFINGISLLCFDGHQIIAHHIYASGAHGLPLPHVRMAPSLALGPTSSMIYTAATQGAGERTCWRSGADQQPRGPVEGCQPALRG